MVIAKPLTVDELISFHDSERLDCASATFIDAATSRTVAHTNIEHCRVNRISPGVKVATANAGPAKNRSRAAAEVATCDRCWRLVSTKFGPSRVHQHGERAHSSLP